MNDDDDQHALYFLLDGSVSLTCPDCDEVLMLDSDDAPEAGPPVTLGDVIRAATEHECGEWLQGAGAGHDRSAGGGN